ncbi:hypothetical protein, partial [Pseudomonas sp. FW305-3-2-15-C-LB3]|uniref:hypothetical protein n=1 Tax=Pseudomonas sp. FW305-3-2-15-C-LB3 TaxID=2751332 RepID=UPI000CC77F00
CLQGPNIIRDKIRASQILAGVTEILEHPQLKTQEGASVMQLLDQLQGIMITDLDHAERIAGMPPYVFYVNDLVSKKAREVSLLKFNDCVVE